MAQLNNKGLIFKQADFAGGLNAQEDPTKSADNSYPLLINGRNRRNVISPTNKHVNLPLPTGTLQGVAIVGSFLVVFIDGAAYYGDIESSPIIFYPVDNWTPLDASVSRIYCELVPATSNLFNQAGTPQNMVKTFNASLAIFRQALFCFDGINPPQAIFGDGTALPLGSYATWTQNNPLYVPVGILPGFAGAKLYVVTPEKDKILQSVSGRASDFVVNLNNAGDKGGDADTVSQTVSYNEITALRGLSTGEVLVCTLYGSFVLELDFDHPIFGEPYLRPRFLFPAGAVNEISIVDILSDTAMITQSGIHAFNAVAQAKRESNNFPFGARIRGLITNPITDKALVQSNTCTTLFDDYAFFAVNTIFGYGCIVYDTTTSTFQSLDLSFGHVKQFASTKLNGNERLFFITHDNKLYEAFAGTEKNTTRLLLGEWTPDAAEANALSYMVDAIFADVRGSGQVKLTFYADRVEKASVVLNIAGNDKEVNLPIPIPFVTGKQVIPAGFQFGKQARGWKSAVMFEWNFDGKLTDVDINGQIERSENIGLTVPSVATKESFAFFADSGYSDQLNPGGSFGSVNFTIVNVVKGVRYIYFANGNGELINGSTAVVEGIFTAAQNTVAIKGTGARTFYLQTAENYKKVLDAIYAEENIKALLQGGDFGYEDGTQLEIEMANMPIRLPMFATPGNHDVRTDSGRYFYNELQTARHFPKTFEFVDFYFFNSSGSEIDGTAETSVQTGLLKNWLAASTKPFKIIITHKPPYTNDINHYPGETSLRYLLELPGISAMLCGHAHNMARFDINGVPLFICGTGGHSLRPFITGADVLPYAFQDDTHYGYLLIQADALSCRISFKDTEGNVLDEFTLYPK